MHGTAGIPDWLIERRTLAGFFPEQLACCDCGIVAGLDRRRTDWRGIGLVPHIQQATSHVEVAFEDLAGVARLGGGASNLRANLLRFWRSLVVRRGVLELRSGLRFARGLLCDA